MNDSPQNLAFRQSRFPCSLRANLCALVAVGTLVLGAPCLHSQTSVKTEVKLGSKSSASSAVSKNGAMKIAAIKSFRMVQEKKHQSWGRDDLVSQIWELKL